MIKLERVIVHYQYTKHSIQTFQGIIIYSHYVTHYFGNKLCPLDGPIRSRTEDEVKS